MYKYNNSKEITFKKNSRDKMQMLIPVVNMNTGTENTLYVGVFRNYCIQSGWDEYLSGDFSSSPNFDLRGIISLREKDAKAIIGMAIQCALFNLKGAHSILIDPIIVKFTDMIYEYLTPHLMEFDPDKRLSDQHPVTMRTFDPDKSIFDQD